MFVMIKNVALNINDVQLVREGLARDGEEGGVRVYFIHGGWTCISDVSVAEVYLELHAEAKEFYPRVGTPTPTTTEGHTS